MRIRIFIDLIARPSFVITGGHAFPCFYDILFISQTFVFMLYSMTYGMKIQSILRI